MAVSVLEWTVTRVVVSVLEWTVTRVAVSVLEWTITKVAVSVLEWTVTKQRSRDTQNKDSATKILRSVLFSVVGHLFA